MGDLQDPTDMEVRKRTMFLAGISPEKIGLKHRPKIYGIGTGWGPPVISGFINHYNPY